ncbi:hypothetical protein [Neptunicoccus cionae]|uniref:Membrane-associated oxidoreductase n=1 Tax=Neptunicoccus cionae TaxID=2035344 RepID=A0A916R3H4_9RHOB|nr:hypothetical protein [Amylibacter cionae]GGA31246.1 hypothetical protein GCM10011498_35560 [Amylibacter cionae]
MQSLREFEPLLVAERRLVEQAETGARVIIGDGERPAAEAEDVEIRAGLIRLILLELDPAAVPHAKGIRIRGARITGTLDFQGVDCANDLSLSRCVIDKTLVFVNARMRGVFLSGCQCPGIAADNAVFDGSIYLRSSFVCTGEIALPGAKITGDLQICDAQIDGGGRAALFANSIRVGGSVYLGDYPFDTDETELHSNGAIILSNGDIEEDFYCRNVAISAADDGGKAIADGAEGSNSIALSLTRCEIRGVLYFKQNQISGGIINFSGAQTRRLNDEPGGVGGGHAVRLDGFEYQDFAQHTDISVEIRLEWLARRPEGIDFRAQPYEHLARVLERIGHREDAEKVLIEKERLQRAANRSVATGGMRLAMTVRDGLGWFLIAYGYRPSRVVLWAVLLILGLGFYFQKTWEAGDMTPAAAPILISAGWVSATQDHPDNPGAFWAARGRAGQDYETFQPYAYAADLLVPIVNLGQEDAWGPSTSRSPWGWHGWWIRWVAKITGWVITALGAAAVTGVIRRG